MKKITTKTTTTISLLTLILLTLALTSKAYALDTSVWFQGFETDASGWIDYDNLFEGIIERVPSNTNSIKSAQGNWHAIVNERELDYQGPLSWFDVFRKNWIGNWTAEVDVYLDPNWNLGEGFEYAVAIADARPYEWILNFYAFHISKDISTGKLLVGATDEAIYGIVKQDLEDYPHKEIKKAGWYTLQHKFYDNNGFLIVEMNLLDSEGDEIFSKKYENPDYTIPDVVGGNMYSQFINIESEDGIAIDNHELLFEVGELSCKKGGWRDFVDPIFKNQGDCVSYRKSNDNAVGNKNK